MTSQPCKSRFVQADCSGGDITSDGGVALLREIDRRIKLNSTIAKNFIDKRRKKQIKHDYFSLLRQRVYAICLWDENLSDHYRLRTDRLIQAALNKEHKLASSLTYSRFEINMGREKKLTIQKVFIDNFNVLLRHPPKELVRDSDATDDKTHGRKEGRFLRGYCDHYCVSILL